jgi:hypothetical protein
MTEKEIKKQNSPPRFNLLSTVKNFFRRLSKPAKKLVGQSWQEIQLEISPEVNKYLEMRHVLEDEVKQVIFHAETTGEKLYQPEANRYLGKLKIGKATFYAEYSCGEEKFIVRYGYAHRSEIAG